MTAAGGADGLVLVVDDDRGMRTTLVDLLEANGIAARSAASAAQALDENQRAPAAVAVVDQRLPDATGIDLGARLKAQDPDLQVLLLTGYATLETAVAAVGHLDEFLTKPVAPDQLVRVVRSALSRHRLRRENTELIARLRQANTRLEDSIRERTRDLSALTAMAEAIGRAQGLDEVLQAVIDTICEATGAPGGAVYLAEAPFQPLALKASCGSGAFAGHVPSPSEARSVPSDDGAVVRADLVAAGHHLGAVLLREPTHASAQLLATLATEAAVALQNAQRFARERETVERMSELARLKSTFLASVSHELRTPLATLVGFARVLQRHGDSVSREERVEVLDRMVAQGERLGRLIENMLDSTSLETGTLRISPTAVDLRVAVDRVRGSVPDDHPVDVDLPADLPAVLCDEGRLEQVVGNLLDNAAKHTPPGTVIGVHARPAGDTVEIMVSDAGPGIEGALLPMLFDPFVQSGTTPANSRGVGLGLYIVKGLVEAMGGSIGVESTPGTGTTFRVVLPVA